jgi:GGDEF domain-containing protein
MATEGTAGEFVALRQRSEELDRLLSALSDVTGTLRAGEVAARLLDHALRETNSSVGAVSLLDDGGKMRVAASRGLGEQPRKQRLLGARAELARGAVQAAVAMAVEDVEGNPHFRGALLAAPIEVANESLGALLVSGHRGGNGYDDGDLARVRELAHRAACVLANALRYERVLDQAQPDALTGLVTGASFWTRICDELDRAARFERDLSLVVFELHGLERAPGGAASLEASRALAALARLLRSRSRTSDCATRLEEARFCVILPETSGSGARTFRTKIAGAFADDRYCAAFGLGLLASHVSYPGGAAPAGGAGAGDPEALREAARTLVDAAAAQLAPAEECE